LKIVSDEGARRKMVQMLIAHGVSPDSVFVEDALAVLDISKLLDDDNTQSTE